jgi:hypothetical protein
MGLKLHGAMIGATELDAKADALTSRLNALSEAWA